MENVIEKYRSYQEYKAELDSELSKTAEGFVRIGYLLKLARDTDILHESGYSSRRLSITLIKPKYQDLSVSMINLQKEATVIVSRKITEVLAMQN